MPGPGTLFTLGAFGAAGAAAAYARRNSQSKAEDNDNATVTPHEFARRRSSGVKNDLWESRSQADHLWRRDYGASFSHNSYRHFPGSNKQHKT